MTVRYHGHHCTQLHLGVVSPVGRDGRPPTLIRVEPKTERERERESEKFPINHVNRILIKSERGKLENC